jgi:PAS domain S-box-containing protein
MIVSWEIRALTKRISSRMRIFPTFNNANNARESPGIHGPENPMSNKLQERIEELECKYRVLADNLLDAIWVLDAETMKYEYMTPSIERISGYTVDEILELTIRDRLTPASFAKVRAVLEEEKKSLTRKPERAGFWRSNPSTRMARNAGLKSRHDSSRRPAVP